MTDEPNREDPDIVPARLVDPESRRDVPTPPDLTKFERIGKAAMAGGLTAFVLAEIWLGAIASRAFAGEKDHAAIVVVLACMGIPAMAVGAIIGIIGGGVCSFNRARLIGAVIFGLLTGPYVVFSSDPAWPVVDRVWLFAALCSCGSIIAQLGDVASRTTPRAEEDSRPMQFTLMDVLAFFIPVAIFLGFVSSYMRKWK